MWLPYAPEAGKIAASLRVLEVWALACSDFHHQIWGSKTTPRSSCAWLEALLSS